MAKKQKRGGLREMLFGWQQTDIVKATRNYHYIEREDKSAFARGYRCAVQSIIEKLDEFDL